MKNVPTVLKPLQTSANLASLIYLNSQVSKGLITKDCQYSLRLVTIIWSTKKKIILLLKNIQKARRRIHGKNYALAARLRNKLDS